jgi:preprotein translocase subunit SecY
MHIPKFIKYKDIRKKIFNTIIFIGIYRLGIFITLPYVDRSLLKNYLHSKDSIYNIVKMFNMFSGGAIENGSIFAIGIVPYITSSIVVSLLFMYLPKLKYKREKVRSSETLLIFLISVFISFFQSTLIANFLKNMYFNGESIILKVGNGSFLFICIITLMTGTVILIWISEKITHIGIGNGISVLIITGVIAKIPSSVLYLHSHTSNIYSNFLDTCTIFFFLLFLLALYVS